MSQELHSCVSFSLLNEKKPQVRLGDGRRVVFADSVDGGFNLDSSFKVASRAVKIPLSLEHAGQLVEGGRDGGVDLGAEHLGLDLERAFEVASRAVEIPASDRARSRRSS